MSYRHEAQDRLVAAFYPYGSSPGVEPPGDVTIDSRLDLGAAQVLEAGSQLRCEEYVLERAGEYWQLRSRLPEEPQRLLARVHFTRVPDAPADAGLELLLDLWGLRQPRRLRLVRALQFGELGAARWAKLEVQNGLAAQVAEAAGVSRGSPGLEYGLRTEGHSVRTVPGPMGTTEHVLLLRRA